jgi:3-oxoacyl-[acyl-carrier protein] reductase
MNLNLSGKTALVCGSTQGIGKAIAEELAELGAEVCLLARSEQKLQEVCEALPAEHGQSHHFLLADLSQPAEVQEVVERVISAGKTFHILINNTGGPKPGPIIDASAEDFLSAFHAHVISSHLLTQLCVPGMKAAAYGRVIQVISTSVKIPIKGLGVSNTIRGAMASWAKSMANELGGFGITVNNVLPGFTATTRLESLVANKAGQQGISIQEIEQQMQAEIPAGRFGSAKEVAQMAAFLASPAAGYINGVNIAVDGGRTGTL